MADQNQDFLDQYDYVDNDYFDEAVDLYAPLIGSFLMHYSEFERYLNQTVAEMINDRTHEVGYVIVSQLDVSRKIEIFYKLCLQVESVKGGIHKVELERIKGELKRINKLRNKIAHADWGTVDQNHNVRVKIQTDAETGFVRFKSVRITPKEIEKTTINMVNLIDDIEGYIEEAFI